MPGWTNVISSSSRLSGGVMNGGGVYMMNCMSGAKYLLSPATDSIGPCSLLAASKYSSSHFEICSRVMFIGPRYFLEYSVAKKRSWKRMGLEGLSILLKLRGL